METIAFRSDYPDLDETCCRQIDQIFPRGSQTRLSDGTIPLSRIAALGYRGLVEAIRLTPVELRRISGEMDVLASPSDAGREVAARICAWLVVRGQDVTGWPPPSPRPTVNSFSILSEPGKARSLVDTLEANRRVFFKQERDWLIGVLRKMV